jgi:hypothetical protein
MEQTTLSEKARTAKTELDSKTGDLSQQLRVREDTLRKERQDHMREITIARTAIAELEDRYASLKSGSTIAVPRMPSSLLKRLNQFQSMSMLSIDLMIK